MRYVLWAVQLLLAFAFGMAGLMKLTTPYAELAAMMLWAAESSELFVRFVGVSELLGAIGLVLPAATRIKPVLTPVAAGALALVMLFAVMTHAALGEGLAAFAAPAVLGSMALFVAVGRWRWAPITERTLSGAEPVAAP